PLAEPRAELVAAGRVAGLVDAARRAGRIDPVRARVVEDDVEDDAQAALVRRGDEVDEVAAVTEARVDVEEVLHPVAVIAVRVAALLEDGAEPERRDAETLEIGELRRRTAERTALPA